ncbi:hypothetical protein HDZ31DRAFT_63719 [Schizophyllum fasciatum]
MPRPLEVPSYDVFSLVEPTQQLLTKLSGIVFPSLLLSRNVAPATHDAKVQGAFKEAARLLRVCALDLADTATALADNLCPLALASIPLPCHLPSYFDSADAHWQAYIGALEVARSTCRRAGEALARLDECITRGLAYRSVVRRALLKASYPVAMRCGLVKLSPRALVLTSGRAALRSIRGVIDELAGLADALLTATFDARVEQRRACRAAVFFKTRPPFRRIGFVMMLDTAVEDLEGTCEGLKAIACKIERATRRR